ncbi:MAG: GntR family transcriptional regulator [Planctomycetota bacterium]|nr:GntR family transcriptional regulator [Planctomycetota bacterium]
MATALQTPKKRGSKVRGGSSAAPDARVLLKDRAYSELKQLIQDVTFEPGAFLSERQLAGRLGMSKTPVKAALERLEIEGFIAVSPQQGIVVRELSVHEVADQFEIRVALECHVLRSVAGRLTDEQASVLTASIRQQKQAAKRRDVAELVALDAKFHMLFCEFHGNREITRVMSQLREKIHRVIGRVFQQQPERLGSSCDEHAAIVEAVLAGDAKLSAKRMEEHLDYGRQFLLDPRGRRS